MCIYIYIYIYAYIYVTIFVCELVDIVNDLLQVVKYNIPWRFIYHVIDSSCHSSFVIY